MAYCSQAVPIVTRPSSTDITHSRRRKSEFSLIFDGLPFRLRLEMAFLRAETSSPGMTSAEAPSVGEAPVEVSLISDASMGDASVGKASVGEVSIGKPSLDTASEGAAPLGAVDSTTGSEGNVEGERAVPLTHTGESGGGWLLAARAATTGGAGRLVVSMLSLDIETKSC